MGHWYPELGGARSRSRSVSVAQLRQIRFGRQLPHHQWSPRILFLPASLRALSYLTSATNHMNSSGHSTGLAWCGLLVRVHCNCGGDSEVSRTPRCPARGWCIGWKQANRGTSEHAPSVGGQWRERVGDENGGESSCFCRLNYRGFVAMVCSLGGTRLLWQNAQDLGNGILLQPPPLHGLLASRHILYGKSECSHIFYAKPLAIRAGEIGSGLSPVVEGAIVGSLSQWC